MRRIGTGKEGTCYKRIVKDGWMQLTNWGPGNHKMPTQYGILKRSEWLVEEQSRFPQKTEIRDRERIEEGRQIFEVSLWGKV